MFVTGKVTLRGGADLSSSNLCAVVANGDVRVLGDGSDRSYFNGLLYTKGQGGFADQDASLDLLLRDVTVQGTVISAGTATAGSKMEVDRSTVAHSEKATDINFDMTLPSPGSVPGVGQQYGVQWNIVLNRQPASPTLANLRALGRSLRADDFIFVDSNGSVIQNEADRVAAFSGLSNWLNINIYPSLAKTTSDVTTAPFSFDLNQFLQSSSQVRVVYRRV